MSKFSKMSKSTRALCNGGMIAAVYAALTLLLPAISYGEWQCRISEALTILPVIMPEAIPGLAVGCLVANLLSPVGWMDIVFGTLATLLAAIGTRVLREKLPLAAAMPVIANGIIVGAVLSISYGLPFFLTAIQVAAGELVAVAIGCLLLKALKKTGISKKNI